MATTPPIHTSRDAIELVKDLALNSHSPLEIQKLLADRGFSGHLTADHIDQLVTEVRAAQNIQPLQPSRKLARIIGTISLLMGIGAMSLGTMDCFHAKGYSPGSYGF